MKSTPKHSNSQAIRALRFPQILLAAVFAFLFIGLFQNQAAQAAVAFENSSTASTPGATSLTIAKPGGTAVGDLMLATISVADEDTVTAPTGWTQIDQGSNSNNVTLAAFYKVAGPSEPGSYSFGLFAEKETVGAILSYSGVDTSTPVDVAGALNSESYTLTPTAPCVTTSYDGIRVVRIFGQADGTTINSYPGNSLVDVNEDDKILMGVADSDQVSAGTTGIGSFNVAENKRARALTVTLVPSGAVNQALVAFGSVATNTQLDKDVNRITIALPSGTSENDLLLASITTKKTDDNTGTANVSAPAGWTQINQGAAVDDVALAIFYKLAGPAETGPFIFTVNPNVEQISGAIARYTGVDVNTPIGSSGAQNGKSATPTAPSVNAIYDDALVVRIYGQVDVNTGISNPPSCYNERAAVDTDGNITLGIADSTQASAGPTGSASFFTDKGDKFWRAATVVLVPQQVDLTISKTTATPTVDAGGQASYQIVVTNDGGATGTGIVVSDTLPTGFTFASGSVGTGGGASCTGTPAPTVGSGTPQWGTCQVPVGGTVAIDYLADVIANRPAGNYVNAASVVSNQTGPEETGVSVTVRDADVAITKTVNFATPNEGDNVVFTLTAKNNGAAAATNVTINDALPAGLTLISASPSQGSCTVPSYIACNLGTLASGATATVAITATVNTGLGDGSVQTNVAEIAADQNDPVGTNNEAEVSISTCPAGSLQNAASVASSVGDPDPTDNATRICTSTLDPDPSLSLVKSASPMSYGSVGQVINYSFLVTNTGNLDIGGLSLADNKTTNESCPVTTLVIGASTTCTASYIITQADLNAGSATNSAVASGIDQLGGGVTSNTAVVTVTAIAGPALELDKSASPSTYTAVGQTINYSFLISNTGNLSISGLTVADDKTTNESCATTTLAAGASTTCTASYSITQTDLDNGSVTNVASASGTAAGGGTVTSPTDTATVTAATAPALTIAKTATPTTYSSAGQLISYTFLVTNTGNVTLSSLAVADDKAADEACPVTSLAPGASTTCTASYTIGQPDIDAGSVTNVVNASATDPNSNPVSATDDATVTASVSATLTIDKTATPASYSMAGDVISYSFLVTNTGNVTVDNLVVNDDKASDESCPVTTLAPGTSTTCTASYSITAADLSAGSVTNIANASGTDPSGNLAVSPNDTATVTTDSADVQVIKTASPETVSAGGTLTYTLVVTNNGPGSAPVVVVNDILPTGVTWVSTETPAGTCNSGDSVSCGCSAPAGLTCELGSIANGDSRTVTVIVTIN